jgi:hypothetical protein
MHGGKFSAQTLADAGGVAGSAADYNAASTTVEAAIAATPIAAASTAAEVPPSVAPDSSGPVGADQDWPALVNSGGHVRRSSQHSRLRRSSIDRVTGLLGAAVVHDESATPTSQQQKRHNPGPAYVLRP